MRERAAQSSGKFKYARAPNNGMEKKRCISAFGGKQAACLNKTFAHSFNRFTHPAQPFAQWRYAIYYKVSIFDFS